MSESILFKKICHKMTITEDKFISQCFKTSEKTGVFDISTYTPSIQACEAISQVINKSMSIIKLIARDCLLPPKGLAAILRSLKNSNVTDVSLSGNNIAAESTLHLASAIQGNFTIKVLNLKWNNIGLCKKTFKVFCSSLAKNKSIEYIDLRSNQITTDCAMDFTRLLNNNSTLKKIDLRWNLLDSQGAEQLLSLMENNQSIVNILLAGNPIAPKVVSSLGNCAKYKDDLKAIQSAYEAKLSVLTKHIRDIENKRIAHVDRLCKSSKEHIQNAEMKISELSGILAGKETALDELSYKLKETEINLDSERNKTNLFESMIEEKERNYLELINKYQSTIETLRQELLKVENDIGNKKIIDEKKFLEEREKREKAENGQDYFEKYSGKLQQQLDEYKHEYETVQHKIEMLEKEKSSWKRKCNELERTMTDEIDRFTAANVERQRKLEKTILDLTENQTKNMEAVSDKLEHCLGEKATVEGQLTSALAAVSRLQQENSELLSQLAQPSRRLAHVLQELTDEKVANEKLRQEKADVERKLEESRQNWSALKEDMAQASEVAAETTRNQRQQVNSVKNKAILLAHKLKERDRLIEAIREEERKRTIGLYTAVTSYMERLPNTTE